MRAIGKAIGWTVVGVLTIVALLVVAGVFGLFGDGENRSGHPDPEDCANMVCTGG